MKYINTLLLLTFTFCTTHIFAVVNPIPTNSTTPIANLSIVQNLDTEAFLALTPKALAKQTGKKLKLRDRIVLRIAQVQVKRQLKKGKSVNISEDYAAANRRFNIGGFLLGFFFSLVGVLIAILFGRNAVRSALLGALISLIIWLIFGLTR